MISIDFLPFKIPSEHVYIVHYFVNSTSSNRIQLKNVQKWKVYGKEHSVMRKKSSSSATISSHKVSIYYVHCN